MDIKEIQKINLDPNDILILSFDMENMDFDSARKMLEYFQMALPNTPILGKVKDATIEVLHMNKPKEEIRGLPEVSW